MNVAFLSKYSRLGASSRLRTLQYLPDLKRAGIEVTRHSLFDDEYLETLYSGEGRSLSSVVKRYVERIKVLRGLNNVDLIWIEKEALPYLPYWLERALMPRNVPYVVDYDDAIFHNYNLSSRVLIRKFLGNKIAKVMANSKVVVSGNDYLANYAKKAGASCIEYVPTTVDITRYPYVGSNNTSIATHPIIGWIGSPSTQDYVLRLKPVLEALHQELGIRLVLVGAQPALADQFGDVPVEVISWSEEREAMAIANFDVGIMPLPDAPWERGKCGYKLIQYMAGGKPVVASAVGVNIEIVSNWHCGLLAESLEDWYQALHKILTSPSERNRFGLSGRKAVELQFSLQAQVPRLAKILHDAAE